LVATHIILNNYQKKHYQQIISSNWKVLLLKEKESFNFMASFSMLLFEKSYFGENENYSTSRNLQTLQY